MVAMAPLVATIEALDVETGLWCDRCALPSGVEAHAAMTLGGKTSLFTVRRCRDCAEPLRS